jgi:hypothetical protein
VQSLTYTLDRGAPAGATIDAGTGVFTWTPNEAQGPSTNLIFVRVTDSGTPSASATQAVSITVTEVNTPPTLNNPGPQSVDETKPFTVTLVATDADLPTNRLSFSTVAPFVSGLTINSGSGQINWTPTESQGGSNYTVTVRVTDNASPSMNATQSFVITVNEVNNAPVLTNLNNSSRSIAELTSIVLTNKATDSDIPTNILTYEIVSAPSGALLNPTNGLFTWTPGEDQGPSSNNILVRVVDNGVPSLSATQRFIILVTEVNSAPVLSPIANKTVAPGQLLTFNNIGIDSDLPVQALTFSLAPGAPAGASVGPVSGVFTWTPTTGQSPSTNILSIQLADDGNPSLSATQTFTVFVVSAIRISDIHTLDSTHVSLTWESQSGKSYRLEFKDNLDTGTQWQPLSGSEVTATGSTQSATLVISTPAKRFYRIAQTN